jgi:glycosyltransferase involved in cell wall biosynthesis
MKILLSAYGCNPYKGSEYGHGWNWAWHLAEAGHEVWCMTTPRGQADIEKYLTEKSHPNLKFVFVHVPNWVNKTYRNQAGVYFNYIYWQRTAYKVAKKLDKEINFDLVHHVSYGSIQMGSAMWRLKKPFFFGPLGGGQFSNPAFKKYFGKWWRQEVFRKLVSDALITFNPDTKKALRNARLILAYNRETYEMAQKLGAKKVKYLLSATLPPSFYPESVPEKPEGGKFKILWVGRFYARKALSLSLEALAQVDKSIPFELTIAGDGPVADKLEGWIKEFGLEDRVNWLGRISWEEVREAYLTHDLFLFNSLRDSFGVQLLEAMACGLPIVALNHQGARDFVPEEAAIKVSVETPEKTVKELAEAIETLYHQPKRRKEMSQAGFEYAKTQVWPEKVKFMTEQYRNIIKN